MHWFSTRKIIFVLVAPTLVVYSVYVVVPLFVAFYYSTTDFTGIGAANFVGLRNYLILFSDPYFNVALKNSGIILFCSLFLIVFGSFAMALLLNRKFKGSTLSKAAVFSPNVVAPILVGLLWVFILDPSMGLINALLRSVNLEAWQQPWIGGKTLTPYSVSVVYFWQVLGFNATIFLAALNMVSRDLYEASEIDGAGKLRQLLQITIPCIRQTIIIVVALTITGAFKIFETVYQLTRGGPNHLSDILITYMYHTTFTSSRYGYGMSIAVVTFILSAIFLFAYVYFVRRNLGQREKA